MMEKNFWWDFLRLMVGIAFLGLVVMGVYIRKLRKDIESWQHDPLTSLLSRRMFFELYRRMFSATHARLFRADGLRREDDHCLEEAAVKRDARKGTQLTVVFIDLDHFGKLNNTYGHKAGDMVLTAVGELLTRLARQNDLCGRYGGEELVAALITDIYGGQAFIRRFRKALKALVIKLDDGRQVTVTASIGAVQLEGKQENMNSLLDDADKAMYKAKQDGRDAYTLREGTETKVYKD